MLLNVLTAYWMSNFAVPIIRVGAELQFVNYFVILGAARSVIHVRLWYSLHIHRVSKRLFPRLLFATVILIPRVSCCCRVVYRISVWRYVSYLCI